MINPIEFYTELGTKAAEARNQKDEARASFHARHFRDARALENGEARTAANKAYDDAYIAARHAPKVEYFR